MIKYGVIILNVKTSYLGPVYPRLAHVEPTRTDRARFMCFSPGFSKRAFVLGLKGEIKLVHLALDTGLTDRVGLVGLYPILVSHKKGCVPKVGTDPPVLGMCVSTLSTYIPLG